MNACFEDILARYGRLVYTTTGISMLPMLRQKRDLIILEPPCGRLRKHDVALYRDEDGKYILHRVIETGTGEYVFRGDHNRISERSIRQEQIVGVLTAFVRDGREISITDWRYRLYVVLWCGSFRLRITIRRCLELPDRIVKKWRRHHEQ